MKTIIRNALYEDGSKIYLTQLFPLSDSKSLKKGGIIIMGYGLVGAFCVIASTVLRGESLLSLVGLVTLMGIGISLVGVGFWYMGREASLQKDNYEVLTRRHLVLDEAQGTVTLHTASGDQHLGDLKDFYVEMNRYPSSRLSGERRIVAKIGSTSLLIFAYMGRLESDNESVLRKYLEDHKIKIIRTFTPYIGERRPDNDYERFLSDPNIDKI